MVSLSGWGEVYDVGQALTTDGTAKESIKAWQTVSAVRPVTSLPAHGSQKNQTGLVKVLPSVFLS